MYCRESESKSEHGQNQGESSKIGHGQSPDEFSGLVYCETRHLYSYDEYSGTRLELCTQTRSTYSARVLVISAADATKRKINLPHDHTHNTRREECHQRLIHPPPDPSTVPPHVLAFYSYCGYPRLFPSRPLRGPRSACQLPVRCPPAAAGRLPAVVNTQRRAEERRWAELPLSGVVALARSSWPLSALSQPPPSLSPRAFTFQAQGLCLFYFFPLPLQKTLLPVPSALVGPGVYHQGLRLSILCTPPTTGHAHGTLRVSQAVLDAAPTA